MRMRIFFLLVFLFMAACSQSETTPTQAIFIPPTPAAATVTPVDTAVHTQIPASPTPDCSNNLSFLDDISIPDGSVVLPGEELDKRWLIQNSGSCNWDDRYRLKLITGPEMGAQADQPLIPAVAGSEATFRIIFTAPQEPGYYLSEWMAFDPQGEPFGVSIFIEIVVQE